MGSTPELHELHGVNEAYKSQDLLQRPGQTNSLPVRHTGYFDEYRKARRVLMAEVSGGIANTRDTVVGLDGWCEGVLGQ